MSGGRRRVVGLQGLQVDGGDEAVHGTEDEGLEARDFRLVRTGGLWRVGAV